MSKADLRPHRSAELRPQKSSKNPAFFATIPDGDSGDPPAVAIDLHDNSRRIPGIPVGNGRKERGANYVIVRDINGVIMMSPSPLSSILTSRSLCDCHVQGSGCLASSRSLGSHGPFDHLILSWLVGTLLPTRCPCGHSFSFRMLVFLPAVSPSPPVTIWALLSRWISLGPLGAFLAGWCFIVS